MVFFTFKFNKRGKRLVASFAIEKKDDCPEVLWKEICETIWSFSNPNINLMPKVSVESSFIGQHCGFFRVSNVFSDFGESLLYGSDEWQTFKEILASQENIINLEGLLTLPYYFYRKGFLELKGKTNSEELKTFLIK